MTLTKDMERPSSRFAREGTAAHRVAEMILGGDPFLPDRVAVEGQEFLVTGEMCRALRPYVDHVQSLIQRGQKGFAHIEQRVAVPLTDNMVWGTVDCGVWVHDPGELHVVDLKYGRGVPVPPDSPQLRLYALGMMNLLPIKAYDHPVTLTVCQPRIGGDPLRSHVTSTQEIADWHARVVWPAIQRIRRGDVAETAGPHCRFCVRQQQCRAFAMQRQARAATLFDEIPS